MRAFAPIMAAIFAASLAFASGAGDSAFAQEPAQITVNAPEEEVDRSEDFVVPVEITGAENLGAFLFIVTYDNEVATAKDVRVGPFLGSSGREVSCDPPVLQEGELRYFCVTLRPTPEGADGDGVLAELVFGAEDGGTLELNVSRVQITDPAGNELPANATGATLEVEKESNFPLILLIAIGVGIGIVLLVIFEVVRRWMRSRRASAEAV
jgi:hypothetical protein